MNTKVNKKIDKQVRGKIGDVRLCRWLSNNKWAYKY